MENFIENKIKELQKRLSKCNNRDVFMVEMNLFVIEEKIKSKKVSVNEVMAELAGVEKYLVANGY